MTLHRVPFFVGGGAEHDADQVRQMMASLVATQEGVVGPDSLKVSEMAVPGSQVRAAEGGYVVRGRSQPWQGNYADYNVGDATISVPATGASPRNDLLVLRVEDPDFEGVLNPLPGGDNIQYLHLISNVSAGAATLEDAGQGGMSAIPLARIEIPASTATITNSMIFDVRKTANPRDHRELRTQIGNPVLTDEFGNITADYELWPQTSWTVDIPTWATQVQVVAIWGGVFLEPLTPSGVNDARGNVRIKLDSGASGSVVSTASVVNVNQVSATNGYRTTLTNADTVTIPSAMRGTTATLTMQAKGTAGQNGRILADEWCNFSVDMQFREVAA